MTIANFIPEIWSTQILFSLKKSLVLTQLTNRDYEGEVSEMGDTVHINTPAAITTGAYGGSAITYQTPTSTQQDLLIDQDTYFAMQLEDVDQMQANVPLAPTYLVEASYSMADDLDTDIAGLYTAAGSTLQYDFTTGHTNENLRNFLIDVGTALSANNVPSAGRWLAVSSTVAGYIRKAYSIRETPMGDDVIMNGFVTAVEGLTIVESNNIVQTVPAATLDHCMAGNNSAITLAVQMEPSVEALRLEQYFADGLRALMVWGRRVVRPDALIEVEFTIA